MKYDFITIGGATEDITFYTKDGILIDNKNDILRQKLLAFEYGAKLKVDKAYSTYGGGAANAAVCLAKLGFKVGAMAAIGDDNRGVGIINNFKKNKVDINCIQIIRDVESGFSFLVVGQANEHIVFSNRAANKKLNIADREVEILDSAEWIYLTSLSGNWRQVIKNVFKTKAKIAWNPGQRQLHSGIKAIGKYLPKLEVLVLNKDEAIELVISEEKNRNQNNRFLNNIKNLLKILKDWGPAIVVITKGKNGADAYDGNKFYHQDIFKEKRRIDTTGVGDAFGSTFIAGLKIFKGDIQKSLYLGVKNSASVITEQGAQNGLLSRSVILNLPLTSFLKE
jgi:ribokinase